MMSAPYAITLKGPKVDVVLHPNAFILGAGLRQTNASEEKFGVCQIFQLIFAGIFSVMPRKSSTYRQLPIILLQDLNPIKGLQRIN